MKVIRKEDKNSDIYILKFKVQGNNILVHKANGSIDRKINTKKEKIELLRKMSIQQKINTAHERLLKRKYNDEHTKTSKGVILSVISLLFGAFILTNPNYTSINIVGFISLMSIPFIVTVGHAIITKKTLSKLEEIEKNNYLLENEEVLNEADLENENILENVKDKDKAVIAEIKEEKDKDKDKHYFDINSIDKLSLDALKKIKANIEKDNYLGLVTTQEEVKDTSETKGEPLVKK